MSYEAPYEGIKVVDLSQGIAGPYAAMLLAQYGADVVKVEPPEGDWSRQLGKPYGDHTAFSVAGNMGKRSIVLDLKSETDKATLWRLIDGADVFIEGFRPGVISRLGFGYETLSERRPRILYVSVSGFGQAGPLGKKPAMDPVLQAFTGFMVSNKDTSGTPRRAQPIIVDMSTALYGFQAIASALFAREREDKGIKLEVSLMQAAANLQCVRMMQTHLLGYQPTPVSAPNGAFKCRDGFILLVVLRQAHFAKLCVVLDLPDVAADERFQSIESRSQHQQELNQRVEARLQTEDAVHWTTLLTEAGIQNEQVLDYPEFLEHPQVEATGLVSWLEQPGFEQPVPMPNPPGTPPLRSGDPRAHAPTLGEHTDSIIATLDEW
ncbi:MAG: CoA transferase [Chromatiales bacterium]|nr:CoA transferase [Chromatiales bacterium]